MDQAFQRRMPCQLYIGLPDTEQRYDIIKRIINDHNVELHPSVDLKEVAKSTHVRLNITHIYFIHLYTHT